VTTILYFGSLIVSEALTSEGAIVFGSSQFVLLSMNFRDVRMRVCVCVFVYVFVLRIFHFPLWDAFPHHRSRTGRHHTEHPSKHTHKHTRAHTHTHTHADGPRCCITPRARWARYRISGWGWLHMSSTPTPNWEC